MCILAYIGLILTGLLFVSFVGAMLIASVYDLWYARKYRTWIAIQTDHTKPKRPAAK